MGLTLARARIFCTLSLATFTSFIDLFSPAIFSGVTVFLVKRLDHYVCTNGFTCGAEIHEQVSASTGESCVVDETSDVESERNDEYQSKYTEHNEQQSNGSESD